MNAHCLKKFMIFFFFFFFFNLNAAWNMEICQQIVKKAFNLKKRIFSRLDKVVSVAYNRRLFKKKRKKNVEVM